MADRVGQVGAIQGVEVKLINSLARQRLHLLDRNGRGNHATRIGIVLEPVKAQPQPVRYRGAAALGKAQHVREACDRQNSWHQARLDTGGGTTAAKAQVHGGVEEELRNRAVGARVELGLEIVQVERRI